MRIGALSEQCIYVRVQSHAAWVTPHWATHEQTMKELCLFIAPLGPKRHTGGGGKNDSHNALCPNNVVWQPNTEEVTGLQRPHRLEVTSERSCCCCCRWTSIQCCLHTDTLALADGRVVCFLWCRSRRGNPILFYHSVFWQQDAKKPCVHSKRSN